MNDVVYNLGNSKSVTFKGTYACQSFDNANKSILYLGDGNLLYYPSAAMDINAFRAYFQLYGIEAGERPANIRLFFGGSDEDTGIKSLTPDPSPAGEGRAAAWYTLDGRKLQGEPKTKGIYIFNGKKIIIK